MVSRPPEKILSTATAEPEIYPARKEKDLKGNVDAADAAGVGDERREGALGDRIR